MAGSALPWETGGFMPWMLGQTFTGPDGAVYETYQDPASPTGYTTKRVDANGVSFRPGSGPVNTAAAQEAYERSPQAQAMQTYLSGVAENNEFNRNLQTDTLALNRDKLKQDWQIAKLNARTKAEELAVDKAYKEALIENARAELGLKQANLGLDTLKLGSTLRGPRDYFFYGEAAAGARQNPALQAGVASWADMQRRTPTGLGAWGGGEPERMNLQALAQDFGGGWFGATPGSGMTVSNTQSGNVNPNTTLSYFNEIGKSPNRVAPGWFESLDKTQRDLFLGGLDYLGHDADTWMQRYEGTRPNQGIGGRNFA